MTRVGYILTTNLGPMSVHLEDLAAACSQKLAAQQMSSYADAKARDALRAIVTDDHVPVSRLSEHVRGFLLTRLTPEEVDALGLSYGNLRRVLAQRGMD